VPSRSEAGSETELLPSQENRGDKVEGRKEPVRVYANREQKDDAAA
jgi:hypothetical protein